MDHASYRKVIHGVPVLLLYAHKPGRLFGTHVFGAPSARADFIMLSADCGRF